MEIFRKNVEKQEEELLIRITNAEGQGFLNINYDKIYKKSHSSNKTKTNKTQKTNKNNKRLNKDIKINPLKIE